MNSTDLLLTRRGLLRGGLALGAAAWFVPGVFAEELSRTPRLDRKSTRLNSSHANISYAVFCLKKKKKKQHHNQSMEKKTYTMSVPRQEPRHVSGIITPTQLQQEAVAPSEQT